MIKTGLNSCFLYRQYYEKTHFSLPPIAMKIPVIMDRLSQVISKNTILWWSFETLCVQFQMEILIALSDITWLISSSGINEFGDENYGWVKRGRRGRGKAKPIQWDRTLPQALLFLMFFYSICPIWLWHHLEGAWVVIIVVIVTGVVHIRENYTNFIKNYQKKKCLWQGSNPGNPLVSDFGFSSSPLSWCYFFFIAFSCNKLQWPLWRRMRTRLWSWFKQIRFLQIHPDYT